MAESAVSRSILRWLRGEGFWATKVHGDPMQERGVPDILACIDGRFLAIESKDDEDIDAEPLQLYQHQKIREARGVAIVVSSRVEVELAVAEILKETRR